MSRTDQRALPETVGGRSPSASRAGVRAWLREAGKLAEAYYDAPYRASLARAHRDEEDLFMLLVYSEALGLPNPVTYYTLEFQPLLLERFHAWHVRMGMERSPLEHLRCC